MFRDFIYLDIDRVQSVLAQFGEGLLTDLMESKGREVGGGAEVSGKAGLGLLSHLLGLTANVEGKASRESAESKILHDYAFATALDQLEKKNLVYKVSDWERSHLSDATSQFLLIRGNGRFVDYEMLQSFSESEATFARLMSGDYGQSSQHGDSPPNRQQRRSGKAQQQPLPVKGPSQMEDVGTFAGTYLGNLVLFRMTNRVGTEFIGPLSRTFLREDIKRLIYKYGFEPQGEWTMLALLTRAPSPEEAQRRKDRVNEIGARIKEPGALSASEAIELAVSWLSAVQELLGSVTYPDLVVSPIAVYREIAATT